jgi:succinate dehydrogenase/fumarate reductase flavoprotein subunit
MVVDMNNKNTVRIGNIDIDVYSYNTVIVGSGAAGLNAADSLYNLGQKDIAIVTEGIKMGTSRNTGSDKQTYYKLTLAGDVQDSVVEMAKTLFSGGSMHGDIALVEAALSTQAFCKLVNIGVPFPHNKYGEYIGYKTDHDPRQRATSAGPLTSKFMTEKLEEQVMSKNIKIFNGFLVIGILTEKNEYESKAVGLIAIDMNKLEDLQAGDSCHSVNAGSGVKTCIDNINTGINPGITLFNCTNIIYATGGPAGMYLTSVYPESQTGASGIAFEAGAKGVNLTESQYGIASIKFRWNLSGTYQQVIPTYVSANQDGSDEREFLNEYFDTPGIMLDAIFLKGYQWPFDPRKIMNFGSSIIDILVYNETQIKGRRVFLDYTKNPSWGSINGELDYSLLSPEARSYLENSGALFGTPIQRLMKMNQPAIDLFKNNGVDITSECLEIAVCAQHNNGGLMGNIWWESNLKHFFPVGEVNGTFGVYRPGGSALNSTQVGSFRAAQYINANYTSNPPLVEEFVSKIYDQAVEKVNIAKAFLSNISENPNVFELRKEMQKRMTKYGAHIRRASGITSALKDCLRDLAELASKTSISSPWQLPEAFRNRDILITQLVYLNAIKEYIYRGGGSRGSYLIQDDKGILPIASLPEEFRFKPDNGELAGMVCEIMLKAEKDSYSCNAEWKPARPIPEAESWFENVWNAYRKGEIIK